MSRKGVSVMLISVFAFYMGYYGIFCSGNCRRLPPMSPVFNARDEVDMSVHDYSSVSEVQMSSDDCCSQHGVC